MVYTGSSPDQCNDDCGSIHSVQYLNFWAGGCKLYIGICCMPATLPTVSVLPTSSGRLPKYCNNSQYIE